MPPPLQRREASVMKPVSFVIVVIAVCVLRAEKLKPVIERLQRELAD
jgi:hypothetical protein